MEKEIVEFKSKQKDPADLLRDRLKKEEEYRVFHKYTRLTELMWYVFFFFF